MLSLIVLLMVMGSFQGLVASPLFLDTDTREGKTNKTVVVLLQIAAVTPLSYKNLRERV